MLDRNEDMNANLRRTREEAIQDARGCEAISQTGRIYIDLNVYGEWVLTTAVPLLKTRNCLIVFENGRVERA